MLHIEKLSDGLNLFKALGSDVRLEIVRLLVEQPMNMNELATASRYNIPVIEVVINNHVLGMVRQWQTLFYAERYSATMLNDKVDFVKVAEGLGCKGIRVTKKEDLEAALKEAIAYGGPVLLDCQIDSNDKVFPMVAPGAAIEDAFDQDDLDETADKQ